MPDMGNMNKNMVSAPMRNKLLEQKRAELAKKKREIIKGQNTQTAASAKASQGTTGYGPIVI